MSELLRQAGELVRAHPLAVLAVSHAITSGLYVWAVSEGKPVKWITKKIFQTVLAAVPASVVEGQQAKLRKDIEKSVIGHSLDGEVIYADLPEKGEWSDSEIVTFASQCGRVERRGFSHGSMLSAPVFAGMSKAEIVSILDTYSQKDEARWNHGKVRGEVVAERGWRRNESPGDPTISASLRVHMSLTHTIIPPSSSRLPPSRRSLAPCTTAGRSSRR
jgi:hypothetical protein